MNNYYYSHGKFLITGEYFVLEGSKAFALPLKLGQSMSVKLVEDGKNEIVWKTFIKKELEFLAVFDKNNLVLKNSFELIRAKYIHKLLDYILQNSSSIPSNSDSIEISNELEFPFEWGLGSSSSLISNLAFWANVDPFEMLFSTSKGSGYDIACARSPKPIIYQYLNGPDVREVSFNPNFLDKIMFVYLGKKQSSLQSVEKYWDKIKGKDSDRKTISSISEEIVAASTLKEFERYLIEHENIISRSLGVPTVKESLFPDYVGTIKSLGAWGGDFVMATYNGNLSEAFDYFKSKGYSTLFSYKELVL